MPWIAKELTPEEVRIAALVRAYEQCRESAVLAGGLDFGPARKAAEIADRRLCLALSRYKQAFVTDTHTYAVSEQTGELHRVARMAHKRYGRG